MALVFMTICVACQRQSPQAEPFVEAEPGLDEAPFRVEFRAWAFPNKGEGMNHVTYGLNMDRAGGLLVGIGNNYDNGYVYRFDTEEGQFTILGNIRAALESDLFHDGN